MEIQFFWGAELWCRVVNNRHGVTSSNTWLAINTAVTHSNIAEYLYVERVSTKSRVSVWSHRSAILNSARSFFSSFAHYHLILHYFWMLIHKHTVLFECHQKHQLRLSEPTRIPSGYFSNSDGSRLFTALDEPWAYSLLYPKFLIFSLKFLYPGRPLTAPGAVFPKQGYAEHHQKSHENPSNK